MQRILLISILFFFCASTLRAQPHAIVDSTTYNFGTVKKGENPTHTFIIKNTGNSPLVINNVDASCGCLLVDYSKMPIKPGMTGTVQLVFLTETKKGFQLRSTTVKTNADNPEIVLYMKGTIKH